ncbi:MAG: PASTA domain-containing protein [Elusimicrobiota bacterium]
MKNSNITKLKAAVITLAVIIGAGTLGAWSVNIIIKRIIHDRSEVVVPDIQGVPLEDALEVLSERNLSLSFVARRHDPDIPSGSIISQTPPAGLMVREGREIETVISSGGRVVFVPDVEERQLREAEMLIRQTGLQMGEQKRTYSRNLEEDYVVSQDPAPDSVVQSDSYVDLVVSMGLPDDREAIYMPDLKDMNIRNAEKLLSGMGLRIAGVKSEIHEELPEGTVISQKPEEDEKVEEGDSVDLVLSRKERPTLKVREETISFEIPAEYDGEDVEIKFSDGIRDEELIYEGLAEKGEVIEITKRVLGDASARIFIDGEMVSEKEYKKEEKEEEEETYEGPEYFPEIDSEYPEEPREPIDSFTD